jgi:hypothetical protein
MADQIKKFIEENKHRLKIRSKSSRPARTISGKRSPDAESHAHLFPPPAGETCVNHPRPNKRRPTVIKPIKPKKQVFAEPVTSIEAKGYREYFGKVAKLPPLLRKPKGPCQMYKRQHGHGFEYPVCAGECPSGTCTTITEAGPQSVTARCVCK